jgi:putative protease
MKRTPSIELLAPAGSPEKMKYAFAYGADAVYCGIPDFSMRARINAFDAKSLKVAVEEAHSLGKKIYVTLNIYAHNKHLEKLVKHIKYLRKIKPDAIILSDPGVLNLVKKYYPEAEIHLSTQANATNSEAVKFWASQGIKRIILAREVSLQDIKEIHKDNPEVELEYFVHGAMCMSYSGRCVLSQWMSGRSANLGDCSQPCRWKYNGTKKMTVENEKKEFEIDLEEDQSGTYFFNSKDLNLLAHLDKLKKAGVTSFKIEGRNKSVFYLATVTRAYRKVLDNFKSSKILKEQQKELGSLMNRGYTTGFLLGEAQQNFSGSHQKPNFQFVGEVLSVKKNLLTVKPHNSLKVGEKVLAVTPKKNISFQIKKIYNDQMKEVASANGGHEKLFYFKINRTDIGPMSLIQKSL